MKKLAKKIFIPLAAALTAVVVAGATVAIVRFANNGATNVIVDKAKEKIYGMGFDEENETYVHLDDAVGFKHGINGAKNDFDKAYPWSDIKTVYDKGSYFVEVPKFYIMTDEEGIHISGKKHNENWIVDPAFLAADKETELPWFRVGAYEASFTNESKSALASVPGKMPAANITMAQARTMAMGAGNYLFDARENSALQKLFVVEFLTFDSQSVMFGATDYWDLMGSWDAGKISVFHNMTIDDTNGSTQDLMKQKYVVFSDENGNFFDYREIKEIIDNGDDTYDVHLKNSIELPEGDGSCIYIGAFLPTGTTDNMRGSSKGTSFSGAMNYRGIENWYGNYYTWLDGIAFKDLAGDNGGSLVYSFDPNHYSSTDFSFYEEIENVNLNGFDGNYNVDDFGLIYPTKNDGEQIDYTYCYLSTSNETVSYYIGYMGGDSGYGSDAGAFYLDLGCDASDADARCGFRLSQYPSK